MIDAQHFFVKPPTTTTPASSPRSILFRLFGFSPFLSPAHMLMIIGLMTKIDGSFFAFAVYL